MEKAIIFNTYEPAQTIANNAESVRQAIMDAYMPQESSISADGSFISHTKTRWEGCYIDNGRGLVTIPLERLELALGETKSDFGKSLSKLYDAVGNGKDFTDALVRYKTMLNNFIGLDVVDEKQVRDCMQRKKISVVFDIKVLDTNVINAIGNALKLSGLNPRPQNVTHLNF